MSQMSNILYIPIQINGGTTVPKDLLERELFIKNGELYVGTGSNGPEMVIGRVVPGATIKDPTIVGKLTIGIDSADAIVVDKETFDKNKDTKAYKQPGRLLLVDEGVGYT